MIWKVHKTNAGMPDESKGYYQSSWDTMHVRHSRRLVLSITVYTINSHEYDTASPLGMIGGEGQPKGLLGDSFLNSLVAVHDVGVYLFGLTFAAYRANPCS
jgi:hypothetical protein